MKFILWIGFVCLASTGFLSSTKPISIFDGKTFQGWEGDTIHTWRIENGAIVGGSLKDTVPHNSFLCTTRRYDNFELQLQFKLVGTGLVNAGVQIRSERMQEPAYEMMGYQADMGKYFWGALYDESRRKKFLVRPDPEMVNKLVKENDWNDYRIRCEGRRIRLWINKQQTVDYTETDLSLPQNGLIGLQIHEGGMAEASYRNIRIKALPH